MTKVGKNPSGPEPASCGHRMRAHRQAARSGVIVCVRATRPRRRRGTPSDAEALPVYPPAPPPRVSDTGTKPLRFRPECPLSPCTPPAWNTLPRRTGSTMDSSPIQRTRTRKPAGMTVRAVIRDARKSVPLEPLPRPAEVRGGQQRGRDLVRPAMRDWGRIVATCRKLTQRGGDLRRTKSRTLDGDGSIIRSTLRRAVAMPERRSCARSAQTSPPRIRSLLRASSESHSGRRGADPSSPLFAAVLTPGRAST